jgi:hypothetical protein
MRICNALLAVALFAASCSAVNAPAPSTAPLYSFTIPIKPALHLDILPVFVNNGAADFYDHRVDKDTNLLLVRNARDGYLYYSTDMARSWVKVPDSARIRWRKGFVTEQKNLLLWDGQKIYLLDLNGKNLAIRDDAPWMWHGSEGIGQRGSTILYAEYSVREAKMHRVWRSEDAGRTWKVVFRQFTDMSDTPQIKHFHLVQPDPYHPGHWYLSSGDMPPHCRVWLSKDDGKTWTEVTDPHPRGTDSQSVHRFTMLLFRKDYLYWATDDTPLHGRAVVARARRGEPVKVQVIGMLGDESIRNTVVTDCGLVCISEAKNPKSAGANVYLFTADRQAIPVGIIPRPDPKYMTGFTVSLGSKVAVNGEFLAWGDRRIFSAATETFLWRLR